MDQFIRQYFDMNTAHLLEDELNNELTIRNIEFGSESRSALERRLRGQLKEERESKVLTFEYEKGWDLLIDELELCDDKIQEIKNILENRTAKSVPDQKFKTRLLHLFIRMLRAKVHTTEDADINTIKEMVGVCAKLLTNYFSPTSPFEEIRAAEAEIINSSIRQARDELDKDKTPTEITTQNNGNVTPIPSKSNSIYSGVGTEQEEVEEEDEKEGDEVEEEGNIEEEGDAGKRNEQQNELNKLREINGELRTIVDQLLERIHKLEIENSKPEDVLKNSTQFNNQNKPKLEVPSKPKFSYKDFLDWLVKDENSGEHSNKNSNGNVKDNKKFHKQPKPSSSSHKGSAGEVTGKRFPVHKWKIRYDGSDGGRRLHDFLKEVEFNARSEGFNKQELYNSAHHLFEGKARSWFMEINANNELETWENVVSELKLEFLPPDLDYFYERQLHLRKQAAREKFQDYYFDMIRLFRNLSSPMEEDRKFKIIFRNARSEYKSAMLAANVKTLPAMKEFGKNFDAINWQWYTKGEKDSPRGTRTNDRQINEIKTERRNPNPMNNAGNYQNNNRPWNKGENFSREFRNTNRPNPNYRNGQNKQNPPTKPENSLQKEPERKPLQKTSQPDDQNPGPSTNLNTLEKILKSYVPLRKGTCFNCHNFGHNFYQCKQEKQIFCEECGFPGFLKCDCPFCPTKNSEKAAQ